MPLTDKMASPTYKASHLSAGCPSWISEIKIGTPCSLPPCIEKKNKYGSFGNAEKSFPRLKQKKNLCLGL